MQFGNFVEQAEEEDPKLKRLKMIKRQVLQKKVQAVRQGAGEDIVASHEPEGEMVEGLKQARKNVGASSCWKGYKAKGTKMKGGKSVPNCVKEEEVDEGKKGLWDNIHAKRKRGEKPAKKGDKDYPKTLNVEGSAYGITKGDGKAKGAMKNFLDKRAEKLKKEKAKQSAPYKNNPAFGDSSHHSNAKNKTEEVQIEAKVDQGRSDYGKASIRNYRRSGPGHGEPAMFDSENKRGKTIDKRREEHKSRRGVKGAKVPAYKVEGYQRNPEKDTRSAKQKRMDDPDTGINSAKFRAFMAAQQKPSKKKVDEHHQKDSNGKVIEHEDTTPSSVEEAMKPSSKAKMAKLNAILQRREDKKVAQKLKTEGVLTSIGRKKKTVEKKPQKAMDAGARGRRMLKRREHAKYVSGSEDNVPDEMREGVGRAIGNAAKKTVGYAAQVGSGIVGSAVKGLSDPDHKPNAAEWAKKKGGSSQTNSAVSAKTAADTAKKNARLKAIKKIKDDRRERATSIMTAEKAAKKVKKEGEDKKFKADSGKPIVAEFVNNLWEASHKCKKCGKVYTGKSCSCGC